MARKAAAFQGLGASLVGGRYVDLGEEMTCAPTTGIKKGYLWLAFHNSRPMLAACSSTAGLTIKYIPFGTKTVGRATA